MLLAERAARALRDLRMHSNDLTLEQAAKAASATTPRGWRRLDRQTVGEEQELEQPAYAIAPVSCSSTAGLIPTSLIRWELIGRMPSDVKDMLAR